MWFPDSTSAWGQLPRHSVYSPGHRREIQENPLFGVITAQYLHEINLHAQIVDIALYNAIIAQAILSGKRCHAVR